MLLQMKETFRTSTLKVEDSRMAKILAHPQDLRYLAPFIGREQRASEVAQALAVPLTTLAYRIRKLLDLGLLEVARIKRRAGSPVKHYRAVADTFFVPFEATDAATLAALLKQWEEPWLSMFHRGYAHALEESVTPWGMRIWRDEAGELRVAPSPKTDRPWDAAADTTPAVLDELMLNLYLEPQAAKALQRELLEVIGRYAGKGGTQPHFLRVMLTPLKEGKVLH